MSPRCDVQRVGLPVSHAINVPAGCHVTSTVHSTGHTVLIYTEQISLSGQYNVFQEVGLRQEVGRRTNVNTEHKRMLCPAEDLRTQGSNALEKAMATHSSVLAWRIPGTSFHVFVSHLYVFFGEMSI